MKLYFVRHTSVDVPKSVCYGQTDVPLKSSFEAEAEVVKQNLDGIHFDAAFSSPLSRCIQLATYCGYEEAKLYDRLKELNFGDWEMQEWDNIKDIDQWYKDWINIPTSNGESFRQMLGRLSSFLEEIKQENSSIKNAIIFTHGGIIACAKVFFGKENIENAFNVLAGYGEIVEFEL